MSVYSREINRKNREIHGGIKIIYVPTINIRSIRSIVHSLFSSLDSVFKGIDLIHLHGYMSYFSIPFIKLFRKKVVITLHGAAWKNPSYNKLQRRIIKLAMLIGIKLSDCVTTVSLPLKKELENLYNVDIVLTPFGITVINKTPSEQGFNRRKLRLNTYLLFLGRLEKVKRVHWIIQAFRHIDAPIKLVIAGDSQDRVYKNYLYKLSSTDKRITFPGFVQGDLKEDLLRNCLCFVLPSLVEGMPVSLLEAMSYGKLCLVSDISAHKWIIKDCETGFLFKHSSFDDFVNKMRKIINTPHEALSKVGSEGQRFVESNFSWDSTVSLLEDLYLQTARGKK